MASCSTSQWVTNAPIVKLTVTIDSETDTTATLAWKLQYISDYAANASSRDYVVKINGSTVKDSSYNIDGVTGTKTIASGTKSITKTTSKQSISFSVSFDFKLTWSGVYGGTKSASGSISVPAKTSYTVKYDANGGSGAPSSQTKWHGTALTLSSTAPTRTGYTFLGWSTSSTATSATWAAGDSYTTNASDTLYAVWKANTYTVSYNANGGSGAPSSQTKTYGVALTLSNTKPTRANYNFKGWATSASATTAAYAAGGSYTENNAVTLYAVWELAYVKPRVTNLTKARCDSDGNQSDTGTCARVTFDWACDYDVTSIKIEWKQSTVTSYANSLDVTASGTSGSVDAIIGADALSTDSTYDIRVTVTDSNGYSAPVVTLAGVAFVLDFLYGGKGAAFGKPAEAENLLDIEWQTRLGGGLKIELLESETDLDTLLITNTYRLSSARNYTNKPFGTSGGMLEVIGEGTIMQRFTEAVKTQPRVAVRFRYDDAWGDWIALNSYMGANPISSISEDTTAVWATKGSGWCYITQDGYLTNQPHPYGFVENVVRGGLVSQRFFAMDGYGTMYTRAGNSGGWYAATENWVKTIDENHIWKTLWSGSWASGSLTVEKTSKYRIFGIHLSGHGTITLAVRNGQYIRGVGGYVNDTPTNFTYHFAATVADDTWTYVGAGYMYHSGEGTHGPNNKNLTVDAIYGIL